MLSRKEFHTAGAAYLKALMSSVLVLVIVSFSIFFLFDLSILQHSLTSKRSIRFSGANLLRHLYEQAAISIVVTECNDRISDLFLGVMMQVQDIFYYDTILLPFLM